MLSFSFTKEQLMIQKSIREFAEKELRPKYLDNDRTETFPKDQWKKMAEIGLTGLSVPTEFGGQPVDAVTAGIIIRELAREDPNCAVTGALYALDEIIVRYGCEEIQNKWLSEIAKGEKMVALAVTEPHCGSDVANMSTTAEKKDGYYIIRGEKSGISLMMDCDLLIIFAKTSPEKGVRGVSSFVVPMDGLKGVTRQAYHDMGMRAVRRGSVFFDDVKIPETYLLGEEDRGFYQVMDTFDLLRLCLCMVGLGSAEKALEDTIEYVKQRTAFGKTLAQFEGVSFPIAEHYTKLQSAKWLCFNALWAHDNNMKHTMETAMCKYYVPELATQVIHSCLLLHGHYGYTQDYSLEQRLRDVIGLEFADGTAQIQKIIISRELMGREYLPY